MKIELVFDIIQNIAVIIASCTAIIGIYSWKRELKYRKRYELAEDVLSNFYAAKEALDRVRFPGGNTSEGSTRISNEYETSEEKEILNRAFVTIERLEREENIFIKLDTLKFRFQALFGEEAAKPFIEIRMIRGELMFAAQQLGNKFWNPRYMISLDNTTERNKKFGDEKAQEFESIIWKNYLHEKKDKLSLRLDEAIKSVEFTCKKYIRK